jgi:hypothetical protein
MLHHIGDGGQDSGLPIGQAAQILGTSTTALRKRLQRGALTGYKRDGLWYVVLPNGEPVPTHAQDTGQPMGRDMSRDMDTPNGQDTLPGDVAALAARMERMERALLDDLAAKDRQISELHVLLQRALERQPMLELAAPADTASAQTEAPPEPKQQRRRWWSWLAWG